ncbi:hypothetical protein PsorP6_017609 [Peronosclerospora sorghi]|uniref:Uncharacterized protein n=1 Tax=Peronosclerospora sorghi TaxID=230839 RepID=A0ACC0WLC7_9STRA|nr:hypothetical protein PsorP6_017609 [Peronosclerospora sorghi]
MRTGLQARRRRPETGNQFPMFGFMPPAPQEHMMRAGVLSRGLVAEIVTQTPATSTSSGGRMDRRDALEKLAIPIGLGTSDAQIRQQMPPGWKPGDPVDLPLDALLHYMGRSFFAEHGIALSDAWKTGDPLPPEAMDVLRQKFKVPAKRTALYDDEVVDDVETLRKKQRVDDRGDEIVDDDDEGTAASESSSDSSESDDEPVQKVTLSLSSSDDESESE